MFLPGVIHFIKLHKFDIFGYRNMIVVSRMRSVFCYDVGHAVQTEHIQLIQFS